MSNFIIRIYRQEKDEPQHLVGTIEHVETGYKLALRNMQEVWEFLAGDKKTGKSKKLNARSEKAEKCRQAWFLGKAVKTKGEK